MEQQILEVAGYINSLRSPQEVALFACQLAVIALAIHVIAVAIYKIHDAVQSTVTDTIVDITIKLSNIAWAATLPAIVLAVVMQKMGWTL